MGINTYDSKYSGWVYYSYNEFATPKPVTHLDTGEDHLPAPKMGHFHTQATEVFDLSITTSSIKRISCKKLL